MFQPTTLQQLAAPLMTHAARNAKPTCRFELARRAIVRKLFRAGYSWSQMNAMQFTSEALRAMGLDVSALCKLRVIRLTADGHYRLDFIA